MHHPIKNSNDYFELLEPSEGFEGHVSQEKDRLVQSLSLFSTLGAVIESSFGSRPIQTPSQSHVEQPVLGAPPAAFAAQSKTSSPSSRLSQRSQLNQSSIDTWKRLRERARTVQTSTRDWIRTPIIKAKKTP